MGILTEQTCILNVITQNACIHTTNRHAKLDMLHLTHACSTIIWKIVRVAHPWDIAGGFEKEPWSLKANKNSDMYRFSVKHILIYYERGHSNLNFWSQYRHHLCVGVLVIGGSQMSRTNQHIYGLLAHRNIFPTDSANSWLRRGRSTQFPFGSHRFVIIWIVFVCLKCFCSGRGLVICIDAGHGW